jgi:trimeric autotransporter adhesin
MKAALDISLLGIALSSGVLLGGTPAGQVVVWGHATALQMGGPPTVSGYSTGSTGIVATANGPLGDAVAIAASYFFSLALKSDGTVFGWGSNHRGQAIGVQSSDLYHTNGLVRVGGQVLSNVTSIAAGGNFSLALRADGTVVTWGQNTVPADLSNVVAIAAGGFYSVALRSDGTVLSWCSNPPGEAHVPAGLSNVVAVATGSGDYENSLALKTDGTVVVWGTQSDPSLSASLTNVMAVAAGRSFSLAVRSDGTVVGWGSNRSGQATGTPTTNAPYLASSPARIGGQILTNVIAVTAGREYSLALKGDGTVVEWGNKRAYRGIPAGLSGVVAIAAGEGFCLAITTNAAPFAIKK